jgi:methyl-accepting chemotaxis protein
LVLDQYNILEDAKSNTAHQALADLMVKAINGESGFGSYHFNGADKTMGYAPVKGTNWTVCVSGENSEIFAGINRIKYYLPILSLVIILISILIVFFVVKRMVTTLIQARDHLVSISQGDLTRDIPKKFLAVEDEIGEIAKGIDAMQTSMRVIIQDIAASSNQLSVSSQNLTAAVQNSSANMEEISASTEEMSAGMESISASTEEITASNS